MGSNEKFCLRWNDFESNISVAFRQIKEEKDLFDCTLSCGARQVQAHKLILSACSPFFRNIIRQNPHQHPLLYLKGVEFNDLQSVLNFMYHGEVNIAQEELNSFLAVAEDLEVKGLTQNTSERSSKENCKEEDKSAEIKRPKPQPRQERPPLNREEQPHKYNSRFSGVPPTQTTTNYNEGDFHREVLPVVKQEPVLPNQVTPYPTSQLPHQSHEGTGTVAQVEEYGDEEYDYGGYGEGYEEEQMNYNVGTVDQNKVFSSVDDVDTFIQSSSSLLNSGEWLCCLCQKVVRNKGNLVQHMEVNHLAKVARYPCPLCGDKFVTRRKLARHKKNECQATTL